MEFTRIDLEADKYLLFTAVAAMDKKYIDKLRSHKEFSKYPAEQIAKAWLVLRYDRFNERVILSSSEYELKSKIALYHRQNVEYNLESFNLDHLIPLHKRIKPKIDLMIKKMNPYLSDHKKEFIESLIAKLSKKYTADPDHALIQIANKELWFLWNLFLLRFFYPGTDENIFDLCKDKLQHKTDRHIAYYFSLGDVLFNNFEIILKHIESNSYYGGTNEAI